MEKISNAIEIVKSLPDYAPIPKTALGPALNEQGYYVGRVEKNLYWVTDGVYQSAFLTTKDGVVLLDAPPACLPPLTCTLKALPTGSWNLFALTSASAPWCTHNTRKHTDEFSSA